jgi:replication factor C subunit 1
MLNSKPVVLTGTFKSNIRGILKLNGYRLNPTLSAKAQLIVGNLTSDSSLLKEAREKGLPIYKENDVIQLLTRSDNNNQLQLWADKYKPVKLAHIIGHKEQIKELSEWLRSWPSKGAAVLITGPPGIGKTTVAQLIAKEFGIAVTEYNASDTRSANKIKEVLATDSHRMKRDLVIMDEVDGMSGSDRGGIAALAAIIRSGKIPPLICIANDRGSLRLKPLINCCLDIKFSRPVKTTIAKELINVVQKEGLGLTESDLVEMCEKSGNDIRSLLNSLQLAVAGNTSDKDQILRQDMFSATQKLFNERHKLSLADAEQLVFVDYSMIPLMVQEAYIASAKSDLDAVVKAAELISFGDCIHHRIQREQAWHLLPAYVANTVSVTKTTAGPAPYNIFPQLLGKTSKAMKHQRQINEMAQKQHCSALDMRLDAWTPINVIASLKSNDPAIFNDFLDGIKFSRDNYFETLIESSFDPICISSKEKTAITRQYNKSKKTSAKKNDIINNNNDDGGTIIDDAIADDVYTDSEDDMMYM